MTKITTLFMDIGGVLLTNGWDHLARKRASKRFNLDFNEMEARHRMIFAAYELGEMTLQAYLTQIIFHKKRGFTRAQFQNFMCEQSKPFSSMLALISHVKEKHGLKIVAVSNEAREINAYRIKKFKLNKIIDMFISSCFVHCRKPDPDIFHMALDIAQTPLKQILYLDDRPMFVQVANDLGIQSFCHTKYTATREKLALLGLK